MRREGQTASARAGDAVGERERPACKPGLGSTALLLASAVALLRCSSTFTAAPNTADADAGDAGSIVVEDAASDASAVNTIDGAPPARGVSDGAGPVDGGSPPDADGGTDVQAMADAPASNDAGDASDAFACDPAGEPQTEPCVLDDSLGVFVAPAMGGPDAAAPPKDAAAGDASAADGGSTGASPASPAADGTMAHPYATVTDALAHRGNKTRIYVCNGIYVESVHVTSSVSIFGGLRCAAGASGRTWGWSGGSAEIYAPVIPNSGAPVYAMSAVGVAGHVKIVDMTFTAPDATGRDDSNNGMSSVAVFASNADLELVRCSVQAGAGTSGADGVSGLSNYGSVQAPAGLAPDGTAMPTAGALPPGSVTCKFMENGKIDKSSGGLGGESSNNYVGQDGTSVPSPTIINTGVYPAADGAGTAYAGDPGANGVARAAGAAALALGQLTSAGWIPSAGGDGPAGKPGQGGGGGGTCTSYGVPGASGGAGGCGGSGGIGGRGGGASLGMIVEKGRVALTQSSIRTQAAGSGGSGGAGQDGQAGGSGAATPMPSNGICYASGRGGNGAGGSGGAGGSAGISVGILYTRGTLVAYGPDTTIAVGMAGSPGAGGTPGGGVDPLTATASAAFPLGARGSDGYSNDHASSATLEVSMSP